MEHQHVALSAVIFKSGEHWVGQCLEYDIAAQAQIPQEIPYQLERSFVAHIVIAAAEGLRPFENLPPAPEQYQKMYDRGMELKQNAEHHVFTVTGLSEPLPVTVLRLSDPVVAG